MIKRREITIGEKEKGSSKTLKSEAPKKIINLAIKLYAI